MKFVIIGIAILLISGCLTSKEGTTVTPVTTATVSAPATPVPTTVSTPVPTVIVTPAATSATGIKDLPPGTLNVNARMLKPTYWGNGKYQLESAKIEIINQRLAPLTINAQIVEGGQVLEENVFTLPGEGATKIFSNEKKYDMNSTNVILRVIIQGYNPIEYNFKEVGGLS